jgi:hypothetical protein
MNTKLILSFLISITATQLAFAERDNSKYIFNGSGCPKNFGTILLTGKNAHGPVSTYLDLCSEAGSMCLDPMFPNLKIKDSNKTRCENAKNKLVELYPNYLKELTPNSPLIPEAPPEGSVAIAPQKAIPPIPPIPPQNFHKEEKYSALGCARKDQYVFCSDNEIYEKVNPAVAVHLQKKLEQSLDSKRSNQKKEVSETSNINNQINIGTGIEK